MTRAAMLPARAPADADRDGDADRDDPSADRACVTILLGLYNGASFLADQLDSIAAQTHANWALIASDDGSTDRTRAILHDFAARHPLHTVVCCDGPGQGFARNYLSMLRGLSAAPGWVAFADQDDVWFPDRLSRGLVALAEVAGPAVFCSRTWITSSGLETLHVSARPRRPLGFRNALVQNVVAGNTILLNPAAAALLVAAAAEADTVAAHDWWVYQLVTGAGGRIVHDDNPSVYYRQHDNLMGANTDLAGRWHRLIKLIRGDFRDWNALNVAALRGSQHRLTPENRTLLDEFSRMRVCPNRLTRLRTLWRLRLYRQGWTGTVILWLAAVSGRV